MSEDRHVMIKGTGVRASTYWMRTTYGEACWRRILARMTPEHRACLKDVMVADWVPASIG